MKARTELKIAAGGLVLTALTVAVAVACLVPVYVQLRDTPWQQMFRNQQIHEHFLSSFRMFAFVAAPALVVLSSVVAWFILKNLRKVSDESNAA